MQREEPYLVLTSTEVFRDENVPSGTVRQVLHGSSARVVKCWVKSRNERNPYPLLPAVRPGTQRRLPVINWRKVGMTSSHHGPYDQGYTRATMAHTKRSDLARASGPHKVRRSPDWSLQLDSMKSESLVIVDQNATVNTFPGLVHTARHTMGVGCKRSR